MQMQSGISELLNHSCRVTTQSTTARPFLAAFLPGAASASTALFVRPMLSILVKVSERNIRGFGIAMRDLVQGQTDHVC